jgi:hypothetical protein
MDNDKLEHVPYVSTATDSINTTFHDNYQQQQQFTVSIQSLLSLQAHVQNQQVDCQTISSAGQWRFETIQGGLSAQYWLS